MSVRAAAEADVRGSRVACRAEPVDAAVDVRTCAIETAALHPALVGLRPGIARRVGASVRTARAVVPLPYVAHEIEHAGIRAFAHRHGRDGDRASGVELA